MDKPAIVLEASETTVMEANAFFYTFNIYDARGARQTTKNEHTRNLSKQDQSTQGFIFPVQA